MKPVVFLGPTLPAREAARLLDATYLPPVSQGDVYRSVAASPPLIGIVDGYFEGVPAVWHKEILFALDRGIPVVGAGSMGALRAAELAPFGMQGVGAVFECFRDGVLEDDDEVAVTHGPAELGYPQTSLAMVDIRFTLDRAVREQVIDGQLRTEIEFHAKALHYKDRCLEAIADVGRVGPQSARGFARLLDWWSQGHVSQKRRDAMAMLQTVRTKAASCDNGVPSRTFHFERTLLWDRNVSLLEEQNAQVN